MYLDFDVSAFRVEKALVATALQSVHMHAFVCNASARISFLISRRLTTPIRTSACSEIVIRVQTDLVEGKTGRLLTRHLGSNFQVNTCRCRVSSEVILDGGLVSMI